MSTWRPKRSPYFQYDFVWKGKRYTGKTGCKTKRAADAYEDRVRAKVVSGSQERPPITVDEACGLYQDKVESLESWPTTRYMLASIVEGLGQNELLSDITQRDLMQFFAKRRNGRSNSTVNREIDNCRAVWRWAAKARYDVGEMPDWGALKLKVPKQVPRELAADEEAALFPEIRKDLFDFCTFALKAGWRKAEVMGLRWNDLDLNGAAAKTKIKGGDVIRRPLTQEMVVIIANQPKKGPFVFTYVCQKNKSAYVDKWGRKQPARKKGERYPMTATVLRKPWAAAKTAANIDGFRFHDLRHTRGTRILRATGNLAAAQHALAHSTIKTTLRYAHVLEEDVRNALEASDSQTIPKHTPANRKKG